VRFARGRNRVRYRLQGPPASEPGGGCGEGCNAQTAKSATGNAQFTGAAGVDGFRSAPIVFFCSRIFCVVDFPVMPEWQCIHAVLAAPRQRLRSCNIRGTPEAKPHGHMVMTIKSSQWSFATGVR
jgi:hypothetical protein